jgi:O-antigen/teichoic acid export membrane protein
VTEPLNVKRVLVRNTAWNYVGFTVNLATNFVLFPYVVHRIGDAAAGIWLLLGSVTGYMGLLELGLVPSLAQSVAADSGRGDREGLNEAASTTLAVLCALAIVPLLTLLVVPRLVDVLQVPADMQGQARTVFRVAIAGFALRMPLAAFQAILLGTQRQDRCNQLWIMIVAAKFLGAVGLLLAGFGVVAIVTMEALVHLLAGIPQSRWAFQEVPGLRLRPGLARLSRARALVAFGGTLLVLSMCSLLSEQTNRLVIAGFLPVAMVTYFSAGWKLYQFAYSVPTTLVQAVTPLAAHLHGRDDQDALRALFLRMTKYTTGLAWPLTLSLGFCAASLLRLWMGRAFAEHYRVVQVLVVAFVVTAYNHVGYSILVGTKRIGPVLWRYQLPQAILTFGLSIVLVRVLGIVGVAVATTVPALLLEAVFLQYLLSELRVGWWRLLKEVVAPTAGPAVAAFAPLAVAYALLPAGSLVLPGIAALCSGAYAALFWTMSLDAAERRELLAHAPLAGRFRGQPSIQV